MKFFIVAILFAFADASVIVERPNCITIRNVPYEKDILRDNVHSSYQLVIDHDTNTLFYSYTARLDEMFKSGYISLKTGDYCIVYGIKGGFANAVDSRNGIVYMGGDDGIYQFDYDTKNATNLNLINANVWQMFYKDGLYFTTYPDEKAYLYKDKKIVEVPEVRNIKVMLIAIDNNKNIVYANSSGVFMYNKANNMTIFLNDTVANGIASDIDGNLYISSPNGLYYINIIRNTVENLAVIDNIYGLAIESDGNLIYASEECIIRLKPSRGFRCDKKPINVVED